MKILLTDGFDLNATFLSGQCFRFKENEDKSFTGVVKNNVITVRKENDYLVIDGIDEKEYKDFYEHYFGLDLDYNEIKKNLETDETMKKAIEFAPAIRLLNQEFFETLCSFIISQNNNIKRIAGIIDALCMNFGEPLSDGYFSFPTAEKIASLSLEEINIIRAGFRGKYLLDAATKVVSGEIKEDEIKGMDLEESREYLMKIKGVGVKVAECVLLYGAEKTDAFPKDVWIIRAVDAFYPDGLPQVIENEKGIAQLFLFYYVRVCETALENNEKV